MIIKIKNWVSGDVIFKCEADSLLTAVEIAVGKGVSLEFADLRGAKLRDAKLSYAILSYAILSNVDLRGADLSGAIFNYSELSSAKLSDAILSNANLNNAIFSNADLRGADLSSAKLSDAILSNADLRGANLGYANLPVIKNIHQSVYIAASAPGALNMSDWHTCETTHCRAGWVVHLAGDAGKALERVCSTPLAATLIYMASDPGLKNIPDFYATKQKALDDMKRLADQESAA